MLPPEISTMHGRFDATTRAIRTRELMDGFGWELFGHPPYCPDLAPSDIHLFPHMKTWRRSAPTMTRNCMQASVHGVEVSSGNIL
ncbi:hypothetical protein AVEN_178206-1 [Araneus ventricosus]|uniref:Histone-lysine N-methyltransferase SETMAR n=1 Tax=Araneus ventricosus TaxID=182803 RepID=A0A4Y2H4K2_ARAVE|nr:hypothetical protein AVEN_178206-1 [Araneus ventricosus]